LRRYRAKEGAFLFIKRNAPLNYKERPFEKIHSSWDDKDKYGITSDTKEDIHYTR